MVSNFNESAEALFKAWDAERAGIVSKVAEYAHYTLPWILPSVSRTADTRNIEKAQPAGSIGARAINHLANRLVTALFIPNKPFFKFQVEEEGYEDAAQYGVSKAQVDAAFVIHEHNAVKKIGSSQHRMKAVLAMKHLLVTGNALLRYELPSVEVYNFHDYVLKRDLDGELREFIILEHVHPMKLPLAVQEELRAKGKLKQRGKKEKTQVKLYTHVQRDYIDNDTYVWRVTQEVEGGIDTTLRKGLNEQYKADELPWIALTWNLARGEDYGIGLVEDYAYAFHAHEVFSASQMQLYAAMTDIKFFIQPGYEDAYDLQQIVESAPCSYHVLPKDALWAPEFPIRNMQGIQEKLDSLEREIAQAFMLNTAAVRDQERVTAEEIRMIIQELETSLGGSYSALAAQWQTPLAVLAVKHMGIEDIMKLPTMTLQVVTGIESLSRAGELESLRQALMDLGALQSIPPEALMRLRLADVWMLVLSLHGIDPAKVVKTEEELQAEQMAAQEAAMQQQNAMAAQQNQQQLAMELAKQPM